MHTYRLYVQRLFLEIWKRPCFSLGREIGWQGVKREGNLITHLFWTFSVFGPCRMQLLIREKTKKTKSKKQKTWQFKKRKEEKNQGGNNTFCWSESGICSEDPMKMIPFLAKSISSSPFLLPLWPTTFSSYWSNKDLEPTGSQDIKCPRAAPKLLRILSRHTGVLHGT